MMNTGQMILVLGALVLFSALLPSLNGSVIYNDRTMIATNAELTAISLAQKIIGEAGTKAFDEYCVTSRPSSPNQLTNVASLGAEGGETYPNFDDVDDYNNATIVDTTTMPSVRFNITGTVTYVDPNSPNNDSSGKTFLKRLRVTVTSPYLVNPASERNVQITLEQVFAFY